MKSLLALLCLPFLAASVSAATLTPVSYSYPVAGPGSEGGSYTDGSYTKLTDGVDYVAAWSWAEVPVDSAPMVGWYQVNPVIAFDFGQTVTVNSLILWASHSDGAAGVYLPVTITLQGTDFFQSFSITPPAGYGVGTTVPLQITGFNFTGQILDITITRSPLADWTMITEVSFTGSVSAVPEPSTYAAIAGALVLGLGVMRRRRIMAKK